MNKKLNNKKLDIIFKSNLRIFYEFNFNGTLFLTGGALKDILFLKKKPKDFDFVLSTEEKHNILDFINTYKLEYKRNSFGNFKIQFNGVEIDMWATNDLYKTLQYNYDGLFYDIKNKSFVVFGFFDCIEKNKLIELNKARHPIRKRRTERKKKLKVSLKSINN